MLQSLPEGGEVPGSFVLVQADTGQVIGLTGSKGGPDEAGQVEIGYGLIPPTWGQGYAAEAVAWLHREGEVLAQTDTGEGLHLRVAVAPAERSCSVRV